MSDEEEIQDSGSDGGSPDQPNDVPQPDAPDDIGAQDGDAPIEGLENEEAVQDLGESIENTVEAFNDMAEGQPIFSEVEGVSGPSSQGPLEVDSVADFLSDVDWTPIDEAARERAKEAREAFIKQKAELEAKEESEKQARLDGFWGRKRAGKSPRKPPGGDPDPNDVDEDPPAAIAAPAAKAPDPPAPAPAPAPADEEPELASTSAPTKPQESDVSTTGGMLDSGQSRSEEGLSEQRDYALDEPDLSVSAWNVPGQQEEASETSTQEASDAISSMSLAIVQTLDMMASKLSNHEQRLQIIQDRIDMEEDGDVC